MSTPCRWDAKRCDDLLYTICQSMLSHLCHGVWLATYTCMVCSALSIHVVLCVSCCLACYIYMFGLEYSTIIRTDVLLLVSMYNCCLKASFIYIHVRFAVQHETTRINRLSLYNYFVFRIFGR
jgi:hypothetical protein